MGRYRKKPVVIEAVRFLGNPALLEEVEGEEPDWYGRARAIDPGEPGAITYRQDKLHIATLEGEMIANPGDWIIQGVKGEVYPCKPDIFAATYEPA